MKRDTSTYDLSHFSKILKPITKKALGKHSTAQIDIIANWREIAGDEIASYSLPQSLKHKNRQKNEATLIVGVKSSAFSLEISSRKNIIIQKINGFFGYNLVGDINTIVCDVIIKDINFEEKEVVSNEDREYIENTTQDIKSDGLKKALQKLSASILRREKK